tara:strand:+ start:493 stop:711 length:219 start_codon:yes stop_codon:yes gene_type:complete
MYQNHALIKLQIESYTKLLSKKSTVDNYQVFTYRKQLRDLCKDDIRAIKYLDKIVKEAETSLQNILNFYPHN